MTKKIISLISLWSLPLSGMAASINWGAATDVSSTSDVVTDGVLIEAYNAGPDGVTDQTVNGVLFTGVSVLSSSADIDAYSGDTGDAAYNALLSAVDLGGGGDYFTLDLGGGSLQNGQGYMIQVWFADTRYSVSSPRVVQYGDGYGNTVDLASNPGQYAIGTFTADGANQALSFDAQGFGNAHITAYQIRTTAGSIPTPILSISTNFVTTAFTVDISFSESVSGLEESDFAVSNGTVTALSLSGGGDSYSIEITPSANGDVTVSLPADSVTDVDGDDNPNPESNEIGLFYISPDSEQPIAVLTTADSLVTNSFTVNVDFNEVVTGLELADFDVENGTVTNLSGSGANYTVRGIPTEDGDVTIDLPADTVTDTDGDNLQNLASESLGVTYVATRTVAIYGALTSDEPEFKLYLTFNAPITGLETSDINISNGSVVSITEQGRRDFASQYFILSLLAGEAGSVTVSVPAGVVTDPDALVENVASAPYTVECTSDFNEQWIVDDDWAGAALVNSNLTLAGGFAEPTADVAQFTSIIKTFPTKRKAASIIFEQSPVWDNWIVETNGIGPDGIGSAPIFLPVAENDYYFFGLSGNRYYTWHSTNMVDWTKYGQVTGPGYIWATTAEYKDGSFYIYLDHPNDHTPHLYIDDNVLDDELGTFEGMVFNDPTHGSDSAIFRDNADGLFHIISEDWTPLPALKYSADSPLATHASSPDGIHGFTPAEHLPPIDLRTEPTGEIGSYNYVERYIEGTPITNPFYYEVHEPEQDSFGDWTAIKIGSRQYLFCDYEPTDGSIRVGHFYSDSIYEEYEFMGGFGSGHPDPTVGFAGGTFYVITQQDTDYYSPGPWVDGVEAQVGVDVDGDGTIDQWTVWQTIAEQYDHTPGFARCVTVTPAQIDVSSLPEGYGFQYAFRVDNTVVADVAPIMDRVVMEFEESSSVNLALGKEAEQSSTLTYLIAREASLAVDGNTDGVFYNDSVTHTQKDGPTPAWWQVDLGTELFVGGITVYNRTDSNMDRLNDFTVSVLDNFGATLWTQSFSNYPNPSVSMNVGGALGRYVRIDQDSDQVLSLAEVEVYESADAPKFSSWSETFDLGGSNAMWSANPDGDALNNLSEYVFGGNPTNGTDVGHFSMIGTSSDSNTIHYVYPRRIGSGSELSYHLEFSSNLLSNDWKNGAYIELPITGRIDDDFESVTNEILTVDKTNEFIRVKVGNIE